VGLPIGEDASKRGGFVSKLMISTAMTVDGVIEVSDWYVGEGEHGQASFDMLGSVDALLLGRKTYEAWPRTGLPSRTSGRTC
jgi:dihydrofolate reductase